MPTYLPGLALGLIGLWFGTRLIIGNSLLLARRLRVSEALVGWTLLAFGTDLPELIVSVSGGLHTLAGEESSGIVVGNAIGSSIGQISLVLGAAALAHYVAVGRRQLQTYAFELLTSFALLFLVAVDGRIGRVEGALLTVAFLLYVGVVIGRGRAAPAEEIDAPPSSRSTSVASLGIAGGFLVLAPSAELTIDGALGLAAALGVGQAVVGTIVLGMGTSLPELAVSLGAMRQGSVGLSLGNIVGSNVFDSLVVPGVGAMVAPLLVAEDVRWFDLPVLFAVTALALMFLARKRGLQRGEGAVLVAAYAIYALVRPLIDL